MVKLFLEMQRALISSTDNLDQPRQEVMITLVGFWLDHFDGQCVLGDRDQEEVGICARAMRFKLMYQKLK